MTPERCETCRFWDVMYSPDVRHSDPLEDTDESWGYCRRYPPQLVGTDLRDSGSWRQPLAMLDDWCGEWRPSGSRPPP